MKKGLVFLVVVAMVFSAQPSFPQAMGARDAAYQISTEIMPAGMPPRPIPPRPIPYHEPGHPSRSTGYSTQVERINAAGEAESVTLTGLDALLADDVIDDPLEGNYRLVNLDNILLGVNQADLNHTKTFTYTATSETSGTVGAIPDSTCTTAGRVAGVAAGDLNGDGQDEQISAWLDAAGNASLVIGGVPGSVGKLTAAPAAIAHPTAPLGQYALQFNGVDQYVTVPPMDLSAHNSMAIEAWVKPADITTNQYCTIIRQQGSSGWPDWLVAFQEHGTILSFGLNAGDSYQELDVPIASDDFVDGVWHRILALYNGVEQMLYVDGRLVGSLPCSGPIRFDSNPRQWIGAKYGGELFNGRIDQVSVWSQEPNAGSQGLIAPLALRGVGGHSDGR